MSSHALAAPSPTAAQGSLAAGFSWMLAGRIGVLVGQWGVLVLLARLGSVEVLGLYGLALAICAPVYAAFDARLPSVLATGGDRDQPPAVYLRLRVVAAVLAFVASVSLAIAGYGYGTVVTGAVALIALAKAAESLSNLLHGLLQKHDRMDTVGQSLLLGNLAALGIAALALVTTRSILAALVGLAIGRLVVLFSFDLPRCAALTAGLGGTVPRRALVTLAWTVAPLSVVMALKSLASTAPRLVLESQFGRAELGYYTALASFLIAMTAVSTALCQAVGPRFGRALARDVREFRAQLARLLAGSILFGALGVAAAALVGRPLLSLVYGSEYAGLGGALAWMMVAGAALHVRGLFGTALTAMRSLRVQVAISAVTLAVALATAIYAIPGYGLAGAVAATVAAAMASAASAGLVLAFQLSRLRGEQ